MKKFVLILLLTQVLISCHVSTQNITIKNINCDGIDLATLGESARRVKLNLFEKYEIIEYTEDSAFSINLKNDEFISILYYNDSIKEIGVFCKNYNIGNEIYIGM